MQLSLLAAIAVAGSLGSVCRYLLSQLVVSAEKLGDSRAGGGASQVDLPPPPATQTVRPEN